MTHPAALGREELLGACRVEPVRTGGPGGQKRNKTQTGIVIIHEPTGVQAEATERRSAAENMPVAIKRLRLALATEVRMPVPLGDARSELWKSRCVAGRIACSVRHWDYPSMLAEAMDMVQACRFDAKRAALRLDCTPSQLVRFVKEHAPALAKWNEERRKKRQHALK